MKRIWVKIRPAIRGLYRLINILWGFIYDTKRFLLYSGWTGRLKSKEERNYQLVMLYHCLEKSLSFKNRSSKSGWERANQILDIIKNDDVSQDKGYHDIASKQVLEKFINAEGNKDTARAATIREQLTKYNYDSPEKHGAINYSIDEFKKGILEDPEKFFYSRYSLREFKNEYVGIEVIEKAVKLALKTPSVCNRQGWHVYHTTDSDVKSKILKYQGGNRPFGKNIPNLIIVASDLRAYFSGDERYQHWIDGGLFGMSLIYAFHSIGVATCALNWSKSPIRDMYLRKSINLNPCHTAIMILAVGYPAINNKVCASKRRPLEEFLTQL